MATSIVQTIVIGFGIILSYGNLDALTSEAFAEWRALNDTWELFRGIDLEGIGEDVCQNRSLATVEARTGLRANVDEVHLESVKSVSL